jgi:RNA polymerase sigma factor (sigma-70 family)
MRYKLDHEVLSTEQERLMLKEKHRLQTKLSTSKLSKPTRATLEERAYHKDFRGTKSLPDQEKEYITTYSTFLELRENILLNNIKFVRSIARKFAGDNIWDVDYFTHIGTQGLVKAIDRFDPSYDNKLISYATDLIKSVLVYEIQKSRLIAVPTYMLNKLYSFKKNYCLEHGKSPTIQEISDGLGLSLEVLARIESSPINLDASIGESKNTYYQFVFDKDAKTPDFEAEEKDETNRLNSALKKLNSEERSLIFQRFGFYGPEKSLAEIGRNLEMSRATAANREKSILKKLRKNLKKR